MSEQETLQPDRDDRGAAEALTSESRRLQVLVFCDSIGSRWGAEGFAHTLRARLDGQATVSIRSYGGVSIGRICAEAAKEVGSYDVAVVNVGNPDVHPRMPRRPLARLRTAGLPFCREGLFTLPPTFGIEWLLRLPFFLFRVLFTRIYSEYYASVDQIVQQHMEIVTLLRRRTTRLLILPLFEVSELIYGPSHNRRAREVNTHLSHLYGQEFIVPDLMSPSVYKRFFNWDWFHLVQQYHELLAGHLAARIVAHPFGVVTACPTCASDGCP